MDQSKALPEAGARGPETGPQTGPGTGPDAVLASGPAPAAQGGPQGGTDWRDGVPVSQRFDDPYYSLAGGLDETRHVFLAGNGLPGRFRDGFRIAELGFGTGLNLLVTLLAWQAAGIPGRFRFTSFEAFPLPGRDLARALAAFPEVAPLVPGLLKGWQEVEAAGSAGAGAEALADGLCAEAASPQAAASAAALPAAAPEPGREAGGSQAGTGARGAPAGAFAPAGPAWRVCRFDLGPAEVELILGDARHALPAWQGRADAWFLDGFSPAKNPELWSAGILAAVAGASAPQGSFATYTAAGHVRRALEAAGFDVARAPGYGRKRHMSHGTLKDPS